MRSVIFKSKRRFNNGIDTAHKSFGSFSIGQGALGKGSREEYVRNVCEYAFVYAAIASLPIDLLKTRLKSISIRESIRSPRLMRFSYQREIGDGWICRIQHSEEIENRHFDSSTSLFTQQSSISKSEPRH